MFTYHKPGVHIFILVCIDDLIVTGTHLSIIMNLISCLKKDFAMKDLGSLHYFLGIQVTRNQSRLYLSQFKYITYVLYRAKMAGAKPCSTPLVAGTKLSQTTNDPLQDITSYRQIVGAFQYCTLTCPKLAFMVNQLCQFMHALTSLHWSATKCVSHYLKGTLHHSLHFVKGSLQL